VSDAELSVAGKVGAMVADAFVDSILRVDDGIGRIQCGILSGSAICAGVTPEGLETFHPVFDRFNVIGAIQIGSIEDSLIGSAKIGTVVIQQVVSGNGGDQFGIRAHAIGEYDRVGGVHLLHPKPDQVYDVVGDYNVNVVGAL
jgi:hypothetical protein